MTTLAKMAGLLALVACAGVEGANAGVDAATKLPLPTTGAPISLYTDPMALDDVPVCKSSSKMNMYSVQSGNIRDAIAWYGAHLPGFKHVHGIGSGRSQDTYYNSTGTLFVSITGEPGTEGQNVKVYSIIYGTIKPGVTDDVISGMNVQKVVCK